MESSDGTYLDCVNMVHMISMKFMFFLYQNGAVWHDIYVIISIYRFLMGWNCFPIFSHVSDNFSVRVINQWQNVNDNIYYDRNRTDMIGIEVRY